jgi:hypothetical protein
MFGLFGKGKSFEQEMADYDAEAKQIGNKYPLDEMFGMSDDIFKAMELQKRMLQETIQLCQKRVSCCKKHGKREEQIKWEEQIAKARGLIG